MVPTLSICIPTYERPHFLLPYLKEIDQPNFLPFPFEVIVVDNASENPVYREFEHFTPTHYSLSYHRRPTNIGAFRNVLGSLRMARGTFCVYVGDDDRVIPSGLAACVAEMQANPDLVVTYALYDEVDLVANKVTVHPPSYDPAVYSAATAKGMVEQFRTRRVMPEIGIYRTDAAARAFLPPKAVYFAHLVVERLLRIGSVSLSDIGFYQYVRGCEAEPYPRQTTLGSSLPLVNFDQIQRGMALLNYRFWVSKDIERPLEDFELERMFWNIVSFEYAMANGRYIEACELAVLVNDMLGYHTPGKSLRASGDLGDLLQCAACETIAMLAADTPGIKQIGLFNFEATDLSVFLRVVPKMEVAKSLEFVAHELTDAPDDSRLIVTITAADRRAILDAGQSRPGLVLSLDDLQAMLDF